MKYKLKIKNLLEKIGWYFRFDLWKEELEWKSLKVNLHKFSSLSVRPPLSSINQLTFDNLSNPYSINLFAETSHPLSLKRKTEVVMLDRLQYTMSDTFGFRFPYTHPTHQRKYKILRRWFKREPALISTKTQRYASSRNIKSQFKTECMTTKLINTLCGVSWYKMNICIHGTTTILINLLVQT